MHDLIWMDEANCAGMDTDLFFPERGGRYASKYARNVCGNCPVIDKCLSYAVDVGGNQEYEYGIYGGLTADERKTYRRKLAKRAAA
jgi:WhiB family redox-sensing transcriptional regulator